MYFLQVARTLSAPPEGARCRRVGVAGGGVLTGGWAGDIDGWMDGEGWTVSDGSTRLICGLMGER